MSSQNKDPQAASPGILLAVGVIFLFAISAMFWWRRHDTIAYGILKYCYYITLPFAKISLLVGWDNAPPVTLIRRIIIAIPKLHSLDLGDMITVLNKSGMYYLPFLYFPIKLALNAHNHPVNRCFTVHNTWTLLEAQSRFNPCIVPVLRFEKQWKEGKAKRHPNIRRAQTQHEFVVEHGLLVSDGMDVSLNIAKTRKVLLNQLGPRVDLTKKVSQLPEHYRAPAAIFVIRIIAKIREVLLKQLGPRVDLTKKVSRLPEHYCALAAIFVIRIIAKTCEVLLKQLGPRVDLTKKVSQLPEHYRALAAIFAIRITGDGSGQRHEGSRKKAQKLLDSINLSCDPTSDQPFNFSKAAAEFEKHIHHPMIKNILDAHGYQKTFMMALLASARSDGKIPASQFIWLKMIDRPLFYALCCVTPRPIARGFQEAAAANAQYFAENVATDNARSLGEAYIERAIPAIEHRLLAINVITKSSDLYNEDDF